MGQGSVQVDGGGGVGHEAHEEADAEAEQQDSRHSDEATRTTDWSVGRPNDTLMA